MGKTIEIVISDEGCCSRVDLLAKVVATLHTRIPRIMAAWHINDRRMIKGAGPRFFRRDGMLHLAYLISLDRTVS